jgi:hypothetical protein
MPRKSGQEARKEDSSHQPTQNHTHAFTTNFDPFSTLPETEALPQDNFLLNPSEARQKPRQPTRKS